MSSDTTLLRGILCVVPGRDAKRSLQSRPWPSRANRPSKESADFAAITYCQFVIPSDYARSSKAESQSLGRTSRKLFTNSFSSRALSPITLLPDRLATDVARRFQLEKAQTSAARPISGSRHGGEVQTIRRHFDFKRQSSFCADGKHRLDQRRLFRMAS